MRHLILQLREAARSGPKSSAQTPAAPGERVYGSERNEVGSASTANDGIEVGAATETALRNHHREVARRAHGVHRPA